MESDAGYLSELLAEKDSLDPSFVHGMRLLTREINRIQAGESPVPSGLKVKVDDEENLNGSQPSDASEGDVQEGTHNTGQLEPRRQPRDHIRQRRFPVEENKLYKPVKLLEKVYIPAKEHPKFNFVGKLLGPRGNTFKRLQNSTGTKMSILGKGSMRDKEKEEELKSKGEPKYEHLNDDLHVLIEVEAPPGQAHARLGIAIEELKKYLVPDTNDEIRQEQMREMAILNQLEDGSTSPTPGGNEQPPPATFSRGRGRARPIQTAGRGLHITRQGHPVTLRRVQQGHQISIAARTAAGLPSSSVPTRAQAPGAIDPFGGVHAVLVPNELHKTERVQFHDTYDPAYAYEAAYAEPDEGAFYEYGRGVTPEIFETAYPAPGRLPTSMAANYKTPSHRPTKKIIREATYPY